MTSKTWLDFLPAPDVSMLKRSFFTEVTPLPDTVRREKAVAWLQDHDSMITLNPLVIHHAPTTAPPNAAEDEVAFMKWYEMTDEIQYIPGTAVKSQVTYKGGFHDLPDGLQTHVFAPGGVDILAKWRVGGNMPGEPKEPLELGLNKPVEGLYLREDYELRCNVLLTSFVKRNLKKSHAELVRKLIEKVGSSPTSSREQLSRPDTFRSSKSDTMQPPRHSMQVASPAQSDTGRTSAGSQDPSAMGFRRSGTVCNCKSDKHLISCPNYTRIYKPPVLYAEQSQPQAAYPTPQPQSKSPVSPALSWTATPTSTYQPEDQPSEPFHSGEAVVRNSLAPTDGSGHPMRPVVHSAQASFAQSMDVQGRNQYESVDQLDHAIQQMAKEFGGDSEAARLYYLQGYRSEMP
ncbi:uncharacterized protein LTR77_009609 [Saxophila tyrrhenica]|uniref:DUF7053 domain-containing protein n=1 Tax=Saxophila tyrrhenica TaxID=1690608 RepID=A0AAV9NY49_9PEZI|nr:hypothetical protein LTR77_009609 [Saxophila tyrrhenica]